MKKLARNPKQYLIPIFATIETLESEMSSKQNKTSESQLFRHILMLLSALISIIGYTYWWSEFDRSGDIPFSFIPSSENNEVALFWLQIFQASMLAICGAIVGHRVLLRISNNFPDKNHWAVFLFTLCLTLTWIPQGFDVTDEGTRLVHSWFLLKGHWSDYIGLKWGGHFIYGLWLHAFGVPNLLWARVAYAIITAMITSLSVAIVESEFKGLRVFILGCLAALVINIFAVQTINYNNTPVLLTLVFILMHQLYLKKGGALKLTIGGMALAFCIAAKFPFIGILSVPIFIALVEYVITRKTAPIKSLWPVSIGVFIGLLLTAILLQFHEILWRYLEIIYQVIFKEFINEETGSLIRHRHDRAYLAQRYSSDLVKILQLCAYFIPVMLLSALLAGLKKWQPITAILAFGIMYYALNIFFFEYRWFHSIIAICISIFTIGALLGIRNPNYRPLIIWAPALLLFSFLGSNNGMLNMIMSGGISLLLIIGSVLAYRRTSIGRTIIDLRPIIIATCALMAIKGQELKQKITYRDSRKTELIIPLDHPATWGIFTNSERAAVVNELLTATQKNVIPESRVSGVNYIPIFNYILDGTPSKVKESDFIIYSHTNSKDPKWPNTENTYTPYDSTGYFLALEEMNSGNLDTLMHNSSFVLLKRK